jgi:hypothetical protein
MEFVSWDDEIPNIWKSMFQTTNQMMKIGLQLEKNKLDA